MNVFQRVESLAALKLIDLAAVVYVCLVFAKDRDGSCLVEGEFKIDSLAAGCDAVAAKSDLGILADRHLAVVNDDPEIRARSV